MGTTEPICASQTLQGQQLCGINILLDDQRMGRQTRGISLRLRTMWLAQCKRLHLDSMARMGVINLKDISISYPTVLAWVVTIHFMLS